MDTLKTVRGRWDASHHQHLVRGSVWLVAATAVAAGGGFLFWVIAAHVTATESVGRASALFTLALFLGYATNMGLPVAVSRYARDGSTQSATIFSWALLYTSVSSVIGCAVFFALAPDSVTAPLNEWGTPLGVVIFCAIVIGMSQTALIDVRLMVLRRWGWVLVRAALVALVRVPFLWLQPTSNSAMWLFLLIAGSQAVSGLVGLAVLRGQAFNSLRPLPRQTGAAIRYASVNYLGQLAVQAPYFVVPVIVLLRVDPKTNAVFYVSWSVMAVVFLVTQMLGQALLVEGGKGNASVQAQARVALMLALGFTVVSTLVAYAGSSLVPLIYGDGYQRAESLVPTLMVGTIAWAATSTCLNLARIREDALSVIVVSMTFAAATLIPAALLAGNDALKGVGVAWIAGNVTAATIAVALWVAPSRRRRQIDSPVLATGVEPAVGLALIAPRPRRSRTKNRTKSVRVTRRARS